MPSHQNSSQQTQAQEPNPVGRLLNKNLMEWSQAYLLCVVCVCFCFQATKAELSSCNKNLATCQTENSVFTIWAFTDKVC